MFFSGLRVECWRDRDRDRSRGCGRWRWYLARTVSSTALNLARGTNLVE